MSASESFVTPERATEAEIIIKKSRFIGHIVPIQSVEDAEAALEEIRIRHKTATHNCYAYRFGLGVPIERFSDDGEPGGTAGRPILEVLRRKPILNALVVVTRYFGGTLLGANGLVHAYTDATVEVIGQSTLLTCQQMQRMSVGCDYGLFGKLEYELGSLGYALDKEFTDSVVLHLWVSVQDVEPLVTSIANWTNGQAQCNLSSPVYVGVRPDGTFVHDVYSDSNHMPG